MTLTRTVTKQAATGSLIGLALGDALGFPTEFNDVPAILAKFGPWRRLELQGPATAHVSDDTQMTLALGRGIRTAMDRGVLAPLRMARPVREEFVDWYHSPDNNRAPGRTCMRACMLLDGDRPWQQASQIGSKGCGANMRVAPVGLVPGLSEEQRAGAAQLQSALTHGHPTALAASDLTARAVYLLAQGAEPLGLVGQLRSYAYENRSRYHTGWLGDLWTYSQDPTPTHFIERGWDECLAVLERLAGVLRTADPEIDPCEYTGDGWIAEEALGTGLLSFLLFPDEPVTALRRAACTKGDSDSIACLTGAFAGAHLGAGAWPKEW
ncbi:ADP-ribosylglycohydrolase family protein, partial [Streptomyces sp. ms191]|uniref:ADP-ribosylglycohydrolase family protein n=1 Tax=Streptomyces sp. ms191 TaxID=1827978 RepID=UPI0011CD72CF